jgi:hypothetical protein
VRELLRRNRAIVLIGAALLAVLTALAVLTTTGSGGALDPDSYQPEGAHALSVLLEDEGVDVVRTDDVPSTAALAGGGTTVFVPLPYLLSEDELQELTLLPGTLVVTAADPTSLDALGAETDAEEADQKVRQPRCSYDVAANAGAARTGGLRYRPSGLGTTSCYDGTLVVLPSSELVVLADPTPLTNKHLDEDGNAALGLGLLGRTGRVAWLVPSPEREVVGQRPLQGPDDVLPDWVRSGRRQLLLAVVVLAVWRGRRLGRVVTEPLPVVVRASETVEGHGRLYHAAGARATAAEALRASARRSLARLVHGGPSPAPEVLATLAAERSGKDPVAIRDLLYGPPPSDDAGLVRLADRLDALAAAVRADNPLTREAPPS